MFPFRSNNCGETLMNMKRGVLIAFVVVCAALAVGALYLNPVFSPAGHVPLAESCPEFLYVKPWTVNSSKPDEVDRTIQLEFVFLTGSSTSGDAYTLTWTALEFPSGATPAETVFKSTPLATFTETVNNKRTTVINNAALISKDLAKSYIVHVTATVANGGMTCSRTLSGTTFVVPGK